MYDNTNKQNHMYVVKNQIGNPLLDIAITDGQQIALVCIPRPNIPSVTNENTKGTWQYEVGPYKEGGTSEI